MISRRVSPGLSMRSIRKAAARQRMALRRQSQVPPSSPSRPLPGCSFRHFPIESISASADGHRWRIAGTNPGHFGVPCIVCARFCTRCIAMAPRTRSVNSTGGRDLSSHVAKGHRPGRTPSLCVSARMSIRDGGCLSSRISVRVREIRIARSSSGFTSIGMRRPRGWSSAIRNT